MWTVENGEKWKNSVAAVGKGITSKLKKGGVEYVSKYNSLIHVNVYLLYLLKYLVNSEDANKKLVQGLFSLLWDPCQDSVETQIYSEQCSGLNDRAEAALFQSHRVFL